jgi:hypothetical protein
MRANGLEEKLAALKANRAGHNRWKLLAAYLAGGTARNAASRLRQRYSGPDWEFRAVTLPDGRAGVGVIYKRPDSDGRAPEEEDE